MSPANIENAVKAASSLVASAVTIGDARPYNTALVVLDPEALLAEGFTGPATDLPHNEAVVFRVAAAIDTANAGLSRVEQIKRFRILPVFWEPGSDELTLTMKLRRKPVNTKYAQEIDELYAEPPAEHVHESAAPARV